MLAVLDLPPGLPSVGILVVCFPNSLSVDTLLNILSGTFTILEFWAFDLCYRIFLNGFLFIEVLVFVKRLVLALFENILEAENLLRPVEKGLDELLLLLLLPNILFEIKEFWLDNMLALVLIDWPYLLNKVTVLVLFELVFMFVLVFGLTYWSI
mgnify:CR=1 FL=1